jgi:hypothetical protein
VAITAVTGFTEPFVQTHPFFDKGYVAIYARSASGSGVGTAVTEHKVTNFRLIQLTDFSFPFKNGGRFYLGFAVVQQSGTGSGLGTQIASGFKSKSSTATGSGTGTSSSTSLQIPVRSATGTGTGTQTANFIRGIVRTSTGSGTGTSSATGLLTVVRDGQASAGTGSSAAVRVITRFRSASADGIGTSSSIVLHVVIRTSTGSGEGTSSGMAFVTRFGTATGSGAGTSDAIGARIFLRNGTGTGIGSDALVEWMKSHIFRMPSSEKVRYAHRLFEGAPDALFAHSPKGPRAKNLYRLTDGSYTTTDPRRPELIERQYFGGHDNFLTDPEIVELTAAGYGSYIT